MRLAFCSSILGRHEPFFETGFLPVYPTGRISNNMCVFAAASLDVLRNTSNQVRVSLPVDVLLNTSRDTIVNTQILFIPPVW